MNPCFPSSILFFCSGFLHYSLAVLFCTGQNSSSSFPVSCFLLYLFLQPSVSVSFSRPAPISLLFFPSLYLIYFPFPPPSLGFKQSWWFRENTQVGKANVRANGRSPGRERRGILLPAFFISLFFILSFIILLYSTGSHTVRNSPKQRTPLQHRKAQ